MSLPKEVTDFLSQSAQREGVEQPHSSDDLFTIGILDSFALVDFITLVEETCGIKVPDADVNPGNFQTIEKIEDYITSHSG